MNYQSEKTMESHFSLGNVFGYFFGILVIAVGTINTFWGNDPGFGVFLILLSLVYFPSVNTIVKARTSHSIPLMVKIGLALFIIWAALGVGELFDKIDMMMMTF